MVARAFSSGNSLNSNSIIFASGVSNSECTDVAEFDRERKVLTVSLNEAPANGRFLYFGTCSVYDPDAKEKAYVVHKKEMEDLVLSHPGGHVIRLPQLAGPNAPPNTLIASLVTKIRAGDEILVWTDTVRNIIDVVDVVRIVDAWLTLDSSSNRIINVANPVSMPVIDIVNAIEVALNLCAKIKYISKGVPYKIDTSPMRAAVDLAGVEFGPNYIIDIIRKYY